MKQTRRNFLVGAGALAVLAACGPNAASLTIRARGVSGMNPGPDGQDRPLILQVVQMTGTGAFDGADFFSLQDPKTALGGEFVAVKQIALQPGRPATANIPIAAGASVVGIVAGFRDPTGKVFRVKTPAPAGTAGIIVSVQSSGLSVQAA